jgi:EmrB/QacA subfamily drug resistance transporter
MAISGVQQEFIAADRRKWWVLVVVGMGTFMSALDASVVATLLPLMAGALHATVAGIQWVITIFLLVVSGVLLGFGRLGDLRGHKDVYVAGFAGFMITSALCGLSGSATSLIVGRVLQALAAAMLFANSAAILTRTFPANERGRALGLQATMTYLGLSLGPAIGGVLAAHFGWRSIFFVNVPVGAVGWYLCSHFIERDRPEGKVPPFDFVGASLFFVALFALLLALNQGYQWGWTSLRISGLLFASLVLFAAFLFLERKREHPMLDLTLFHNRIFSGSAFSAMVTYVAHTATQFLIPFYLIQGRGLDPEHCGLILMAQPVMMMISAPVAGALSDRIGSRRPTVIGLVVLIAGLLLLSRCSMTTSLWYIAGMLAVCGLGFGCFVAPNNNRMLSAAPTHRRGIASGVLAAARNVGMVLGIALAGAVYTTVLAHRPGRIAEAVSIALVVTASVIVLSVITSWMEGELPDEQLAAKRAYGWSETLD